jgi:hypothetical protein
MNTEVDLKIKLNKILRVQIEKKIKIKFKIKYITIKRFRIKFGYFLIFRNF